MGRIRDERGESLIEIMLVIMVMGVGMVAVVASLGTLIIGTDVHHGLAEGEVVVRDYGEAIKTEAITASAFTKCPSAAQLTPTVPGDIALPPGWSAAIDKVEWWVPNPAAFPNGTWTTTTGSDADSATCLGWYAACGSDVPGCDTGLQRVTFTVQNARADYAKATITGRVLTRRNNA